MRRLAVLVGLVAFAGLACGRDRSTPALPARAPDARLEAAFADVFRQAAAAAGKARELHERERLRISATRPGE